MITYDRYTIYKGPTYTVEWYFDMNGRMPGLEFFNQLSRAEQDRLLHIVKYMADQPRGTILPKTLYNLEDQTEKIFAFKPRDRRYFNFITTGSRIIITNAYTKQAQKLTKKSKDLLAAAIRSKGDYLRRCAEGTYYESK